VAAAQAIAAPSCLKIAGFDAEFCKVKSASIAKLQFDICSLDGTRALHCGLPAVGSTQAQLYRISGCVI
jgi:hypothetical protein